MGISVSCPLAELNDVESGLDSVLVKSISFGDASECRTPARSVSFKSTTLEPTISKSLGSGKMIVEKSISLKGSELEKFMLHSKSLNREGQNMEIYQSKSDITAEIGRESTILDPKNPKHEAAIRLQKVYKSFRTRRKLADCAVLVEQSWWKLLDFAELKRSSISFFDEEKHETAISRWCRARTRAAKVGKGLSKNDKAQKLALQHWLEAIDPRHRYGHNLRFYYNKWLHCQSREPFFYWLDIGEGREVNLVEKCPRWKLQQQCIKYLGPMERKAYEVVLEEGKLFYKQTGELLDTISEESDDKWIFVLSTSKVLYIGKKKKGTFQHSSFLAGGAAVAAGRLVIETGILKAVWPHSGHYQPTEENFKDFISFLQESNLDLSDVKMNPTDEDEFSIHKLGSTHIRTHSLEEDFDETLDCVESERSCLVQEKPAPIEEETDGAIYRMKSTRLKNLEIPEKGDFCQMLRCENPIREANSIQISDGYESADDDDDDVEIFDLEQEPGTPEQHQMEEESKESEVTKIPEESTLNWINSKKETGSFQLRQQLSRKWTTGAGPRISCVRDYPSELQVRALEQVSLSPKSASVTKSYFSPRHQISSQLFRETSMPEDGIDWS